MLPILIVLACSALLLAHIAAFYMYVDYKLDQLIKKRYTLEWNIGRAFDPLTKIEALDALAACNDRIQRWVRIRDIIKL